MSFCNSACTGAVPAMPNSGCDIVTRPAGIKRVIFAKCDIEFLDLTDLTEWETKLTADDVHATGDILGSKPKGSFNRKKLASCMPEKVVSGQKNIQFTDANSDNTAFEDYAFYNHIQNNNGNLVMGYLTCDDLFFGWFDDITTEIDDTRGDNSDDEAVFDATVYWNATTMRVPVHIPGLDAVLT